MNNPPTKKKMQLKMSSAIFPPNWPGWMCQSRHTHTLFPTCSKKQSTRLGQINECIFHINHSVHRFSIFQQLWLRLHMKVIADLRRCCYIIESLNIMDCMELLLHSHKNSYQNSKQHSNGTRTRRNTKTACIRIEPIRPAICTITHLVEKLPACIFATKST